MSSERGFGNGYFAAVFLLLAWLLAWPTELGAQDTGTLSAPEWRSKTGAVSEDGYATLEWANGTGSRAGLYRLIEKMNSQRRTTLVEGGSLRIYRVVPGKYTFRVQACSAGGDGTLKCGPKSNGLTLHVSESASERILQAAKADIGALDGTSIGVGESASAHSAGGPGQLRPGLWFSPDRSGHGFSFYWANRLSLPESHEMHGFEYDLHGIWYTYEAKASSFERGASWSFFDYQPLAVRLKLVRDDTNGYSGSVYVTRDGQESAIGTASLSFGPDNANAQIEWTVDFKLQRLSGQDSLLLLAGSEPNDARNATHYAGIWDEPNGNRYQVVDDVGSVSEAVNILFEDASGDTTWIQAANSGTPVENRTDLCFYYVGSGYAPNAQGRISYSSLGCQYASDASAANRNGFREFTGFEHMNLWATANLPGGRGGIEVGSANQPASLQKMANFHRVYFSQAGEPCELVAGVCTVELNWFTDGDYPYASLFRRNLATGQTMLLVDSAGAVVTGHRIDITEQGDFVFELRMGNSPSSTLMAESAVLQVVRVGLQRPEGLIARWTDQSRPAYRVEWSHPNTVSIDHYELQEWLPDSEEPVLHTVSPSSTTMRDFAKPDGPFGAYRYRVRACTGVQTGPECSAWSDELSWPVVEPGGSTGEVIHPWANLSSDAGTLIKNIAMDYAMGYHFRPETDGVVNELGGLFNGFKTVRLFRRSTGEVLAEATVSSANDWQHVPISGVAVQAGEEYTVAVYLAGSGGNYYNAPDFPASHGGIEILGSTYAYTGSNPDAIPVNEVTHSMYGQADIGFVEAISNGPGPDPDPGPDPAPPDPDTPPAPAAKPSFKADPESVSAGAIDGEFFVDTQGVANYVIPILTAPGSGGLAPELSLHYRSQGANDVMGVGWAVGGQSSITRCPATREHDGVPGSRGVSLDNGDRFCLDGQRLVAVEGEYGAPDTEYRLEIDDHSKVISMGQAGKGPARFEHWHGDGSVTHYGNSANSRIEARIPGDDSTVLTWAVNRRQDAAGNYIDYEYEKRETGPVEATLSSVRYTGNTRAGTSPFAEVRFHYEDGRTDIPDSHILGGTFAHRKLLTRVDSMAKVRQGDASMQTLRSWFLEYGQDGFGRAILESIEACSNAQKSFCHQPTRFDWLRYENSISETGVPIGSLFSRKFKNLVLADVNGDGLTDLLIVEGTNSFSFKVAYAMAGGTFELDSTAYAVPADDSGNSPVRLLTIDLDGDSRQDVVYPKRTGTSVNWVTRLAKDGGFDQERVVAPDCCGHVEPEVASVLDFNGDGLADLLTHGGAEAAFWQGNLMVLINGTVPGETPKFLEPRPVVLDFSPELFPEDPQNGWHLELGPLGFTEITDKSTAAVQAFDYDGDGDVDLLARIFRRYTHCGTNCINASGSSVGSAIYDSTPTEISFADIAADSSDDSSHAVAFFIVFESDGDGRYLQREVVARDADTGCAVPAACSPWAGLPEVSRMLPVDINSDGLADLAYQDRWGNWSYRINTGRGFDTPVVIGSLPDSELGEHVRFLDLTGDGFPEFIYPSSLSKRSATWKVHSNDLGSGFGAVERSDIALGKQSEGDTSILADFNGDGAVDNLLLDFRNGRVRQSGTKLYRGVNLATASTHQSVNAISAVVDGFGKRLEIEYGPLTDPLVHSRLHNARLAEWGNGSAVFDLVAPVYVVSSVSRSAPVHGDPSRMAKHHYHYVGGKIQSGGRGFLGFAEVIQWSPETGIRRNSRYRQDFPYTGLPVDTMEAIAGYDERHDSLSTRHIKELPEWPGINATTAVPGEELGGTLVAYTVSEWQSTSNGGTWNRRQLASLELGWSPNGEPVAKKLLSNRYAQFDRLVESAVQTWDPHVDQVALTVTTKNEFHPADLARWNLHQVAATTVHHERPGEPSITRTSAFTYDSVSGRMVRETTEPDDEAFHVVSVYELDTFGNRTRTTVSAADVPARESRLEYDALGRFATAEYNHFGQRVMKTREWNAFGTPLKVSDIDGVITESFADPMGRVFASWTETGSWEQKQFGLGAGAVCPSGTALRSHVRTAGGPDTYTCLDRLQREIRSVSVGFNGGMIYTDTSYDAAGRPVQVSEPYFAGDARYWNVMTYDELGRVIRVDAANGNDVSTRFGTAASGSCGVNSPFAVESVNGLGQRRQEVGNALGETVKVYDDACGMVISRYDAVGNLIEVTGASGSRVRMNYDRAGRRISMTDPDKGHWQYAWNALGEMLRQLDAKGQAMDFEYDGLGRVTTRKELSGVDSIGDTAVVVESTEETDWNNSKSTASRGKGQPLSIRYLAGVTGDTAHHQAFEYDDFGRVRRVISTIAGMQFTEETTYDEYGRTFQEFDASGDFRGLRYRYNVHGYLDQVVESRDGAEAVVYRDVEAMDARGNPVYTVLGNGVEVFATRDPASGQLETLEAYDSSGRELQEVDYRFDVLGNLLQRADRSDGGDQAEDFTYDGLNRLTRVELTAPSSGISSPAETLSLDYDAAGNITYKSDVGSYRYGDGGAGPHALTRAGGQAYSYDANGNQVAGAGRTIGYSLFDKPVHIERGGQFTSFEYGIAHRRITRVDDSGIDGRKTTYYIGGVEYTDDGVNTYFRRNLAGVAIAKFYPATQQSDSLFTVKDHLGSVHNLTDETGRIDNAVWMSFGAFGQRRAPAWNAGFGSEEKTHLNNLTNRGFTGHEHVDSMGLIHMNGRIYDPALGRFLQADPLVQAPDNTQALNRYSYALNNPLSYTDPSGYFLKRFVKRWGRLTAALVLSAVLPGSQGILATVFEIGGTYAQAAITGFIAGAITSGTFKGAVVGAFTAVLVAGVVKAHSTAEIGSGMAKSDEIIPTESTLKHLHGNSGESQGIYRVYVESDGALLRIEEIASKQIGNSDVIFTNGVKNSFSDAVKNGTIHLYQKGILGDSYVLNYNPTVNFGVDLLEASRDIIGAHTGWTHSSLARNLAGLVDRVSGSGVTGLRLVGHSQGGAITASALRYASKTGLNLSALSGGGASLHGAPVNAWMARQRLGSRIGVKIVSHHQFGDAVHVLGGLNLSNPLEVPIALLRAPSLFSGDPSLNPHSMPCGNSTTLVCGH